MSIDLLPFSAFALESCAAPAVAPGEGRTLTLSLRIGRSAGADTIAGRLTLRPTEAPLPGVQHVGVTAAAEAAPITITF